MMERVHQLNLSAMLCFQAYYVLKLITLPLIPGIRKILSVISPPTAIAIALFAPCVAIYPRYVELIAVLVTVPGSAGSGFGVKYITQPVVNAKLSPR